MRGGGGPTWAKTSLTVLVVFCTFLKGEPPNLGIDREEFVSCLKSFMQCMSFGKTVVHIARRTKTCIAQELLIYHNYVPHGW